MAAPTATTQTPEPTTTTNEASTGKPNITQLLVKAALETHQTTPGTAAVRSTAALLKPVDFANVKLCLLIYGDNGVGKTYLAAGMPGRKLFINAAGNIETLLQFPREGPNGWDAVQWPKQWSQMQRMFIEKVLDEYPVIVCDNLTGVYRLLLDDSCRVNGHQTPEINDYGLSSERLRWISSKLRERRDETPQHVIAICHRMAEKDSVTESIVAGPSMPGKVPSHITSLFPEFCYVEVGGGGKRILHFEQTGMWPAATRMLQKKKWENVTLAEVYKPFFKEEELALAEQVIKNYAGITTPATTKQ